MSRGYSIIRCLAVFTLVTVLGCRQAYLNSEEIYYQELQEESDRIISEIVSDFPGLTVTIMKEGVRVYAYQSGFEDIEEKVPVNANTKFNIYSTSKAALGLAFARLEDQGLVSLSHRVGDIDPALPPQFHEITIEQLLSHRSGIQHYTSAVDWISFSNLRCDQPSDAMPHFINRDLAFVPGTDELYSSYAFVLASHLLMQLTEHDDFIEALNWSLGDWAGFELDSDNAVKVQPFIKAGRLPNQIVGMPPETIIPLPNLNAQCKFGAGGLIATSQQLALLGSSLYEGDIISKPSLEHALIESPAKAHKKYGAAIAQRADDLERTTTYSLSGGAPGGRSYLIVMVEGRVAVGITANIEGPNLGDLSKELADLWISTENGTDNPSPKID